MSWPTLNDLPAAVERQGEALFVKTPLYRSQRSCRPVYIDPDLYARFWGEPNATWETMAATLASFFSITIEPQRAAGAPIGWAYVDRQADPLGVALAGNQGSGRAYYVGRAFNVKGEKTPLATSTTARLADGLVEGERGIWETMMANVAAHDLAVGAPPVLAILYLGETCRVAARDHPVPRVMIVRCDDVRAGVGALDRITHLFRTGVLPTGVTLDAMADAFGAQSAQAFAARILHGAWSPGNISPAGHMQDFDTVCAVKGRAPQSSMTPWHVENYFGEEQRGLAHILRALADDSRLNREGISSETLVQGLEKSRARHGPVELVRLAGFPNATQLSARFSGELQSLWDRFVPLAQKMLPSFDTLSARGAQAADVHLFDFSTFFRTYPIERRFGVFQPARAVRAMMPSRLPVGLFHPKLPDLDVEDAAYFNQHVAQPLTPHVVRSADEQAALRAEVESWVADYDIFFGRLQTAGGADETLVEARAYVTNEDRALLFPAFSPAYLLASRIGVLPDAAIDRWVRLFSAASRRVVPDDQTEAFVADIRPHALGYLATRLDGAGLCRSVCVLFKEGLPVFVPLALAENKARFQIDGHDQPFTLRETMETIDIEGPPRLTLTLALTATRESALLRFPGALICQGRDIVGGDYLDQEA
jgi:hypothetical protein